MKFNISTLSAFSIQNSNLSLYISHASGTGETELSYIYELDNQTWDEGVVTYNKPATGIKRLIDTNTTIIPTAVIQNIKKLF